MQNAISGNPRKKLRKNGKPHPLLNARKSESILSILDTTLDSVIDNRIKIGIDVQSHERVEIVAKFFINALMSHISFVYGHGLTKKELPEIRDNLDVLIMALEGDIYSNLDRLVCSDPIK